MDHAQQTAPRTPNYRPEPPTDDTNAPPAPVAAVETDYVSYYLPDGAHV